MKLIHPDFSFKIEFEDSTINLLIMENRVFFRENILELRGQAQGEAGPYVLSQNNKELDMAKYLELIVDPLTIDLNSRKLINRVYAQLDQLAVNEDNYLATMDIKTELEAYLIRLIEGVDYDLSYSLEIDLKQVFKAMDLKMEEEHENYLEALLGYIWTIREIFGSKLFIFVNLKSYLSQKEYEDFYKFIAYEKIAILLVENRETGPKYSWEKKWIIDQDICDIY